MILRRLLMIALAVPLSAAAGMGGWAGYLQATGNIHTVAPGRLYRSAQLDGEALTRIVHADGIKAVLNLRGAHPGMPWYDGEMRVAARLGVRHYDLTMSANREPDRATLHRLVEILRTAPKPLLVHCKEGADRSGLAAAIYELALDGRNVQEAGEQLSFRYGHFPWLTSRTGAMDRAFRDYAQRFAERRRAVITTRASPAPRR